MPSRRHSPLGRIVALVLLLWTAVDLTNSGLCALENESVASFSAATTTIAAADWDARTGLPDREAVHVDDCFCCSHCVEVGALFPTTVVSPVSLRRTALVVPAPRIFGSSIYHPPLG